MAKSTGDEGLDKSTVLRQGAHAGLTKSYKVLYLFFHL